MPYCPSCGVQVENGTAACPLCDTPIPVLEEEQKQVPLYPSREKQPMQPRQVRALFWTVITSLSFIGFAVVLAVDLVINGKLTWGGYALSGIAAGWLLSSVLAFLMHRPVLVVAGLSVISAGLLVLLDINDGSLDWFLTLGLPIMGIGAVEVSTAIFLYYASEKPRADFGAVFLLVTTVSCIGLDLLISSFMGELSLSWSFIVMSATLPVSILLVFYRYYLSKIVDLKRIFHL